MTRTTKTPTLPAITALLGRDIIIVEPTKWNISTLRFCFKKTSFQIMFSSCCAIPDAFRRFIKFVSGPLAETLFQSILSSDHQIRIAKFSTMAAKMLWFSLQFKVENTHDCTKHRFWAVIYILYFSTCITKIKQV